MCNLILVDQRQVDLGFTGSKPSLSSELPGSRQTCLKIRWRANSEIPVPTSGLHMDPHRQVHMHITHMHNSQTEFLGEELALFNQFTQYS